MKAPKFRSPSGYFVNLDFGFQNEINAEQDKQYPALYIEHNISLTSTTKKITPRLDHCPDMEK